MASRLAFSPSSLFSHRQYFSTSNHYSSSSSPSNFKFKTLSHLNRVSLKLTGSGDPHGNSSSSSKNRTWVKPNSPRPKLLRKKPSGQRNTFLLKLAESLDSCDPTEQQVSTILKDLGDNNVSERDAVLILDNMTNTRTAPIVLRYLRDKIQHARDNGVVLYNVTLKVFRKCKDFEGAQKVFDEMLQRGVKPDNITFTTMINCARMSALPDKAVEWFQKMPGFGCEPDAITCSAMVCAYALTNHVDMAIKLYDRAKREKWPLDAVTFAALIKMYDALGNFDRCLNVYLEVKALGVRPSLKVYNTLLVAMLRGKRAWQAKTIYQEMKRNGVSPNFITCSTLLRVYTRAKFGEDALDIYKNMKGNRMDVSIDLYNVLLAMCADVGFNNEAVEVFEDMKSSGTCQPDSWTYSAMISVYSVCGKVLEVEGMMQEMIKFGFKPNVFVMTSLVQCYGKAKRTDDVVKAFNQLLDMGIAPDDRFCGCLLNVMTQTPKEELGKITDCIEKANLKLGSVVRFLLEEQKGDADFRKEVSELFNSIDAEAKRPLCNSLIDLCIKLNVPDIAHDLFDIGLALEIYNNIQSKSQTKWSLYLKSLSIGAAMTALHVWINDLYKTLESGEELPPLLRINTGRGKLKYSSKSLASVLESHLKELNAPFLEAPNKAGWFLVTKDAAESWLESRASTKTIALDSLVLGSPTMALLCVCACFWQTITSFMRRICEIKLEKSLMQLPLKM